MKTSLRLTLVQCIKCSHLCHNCTLSRTNKNWNWKLKKQCRQSQGALKLTPRKYQASIYQPSILRNFNVHHLITIGFKLFSQPWNGNWTHISWGYRVRVSPGTDPYTLVAVAPTSGDKKVHARNANSNPFAQGVWTSNFQIQLPSPISKFQIYIYIYIYVLW